MDRKTPSVYYTAWLAYGGLLVKHEFLICKTKTEAWLCLCPGCSVLPVSDMDRRSAFLPLHSGTCRWVIVYRLFRSAALKATFLTALFHSLRIRACRSLTLWSLTNPFNDLRLNSFSSRPCCHEIKASCPKTYSISLSHTHTRKLLCLTRSYIKHLWTVSNIYTPCSYTHYTSQFLCPKDIDTHHYIPQILLHMLESFAWIRALFTSFSERKPLATTQTFPQPVFMY